MLLLQMAIEDVSALGPFRTQAGWELHADAASVWVRCPVSAADDCAGLPCRGKYRVDAQGCITPWQGTVPVGNAPGGPWQALSDFLTVTAPVSGMPARARARLEITLQRSARVRTAESLLLEMSELAAWVERAPKVRLQRLKFAAAADGRALVLGSPLPPLPGVAHYHWGTMAIPCGWEFASHVWPGWVESSLALPKGALALVGSDARLEIIGEEGFTPLTLAAVRLTLLGPSKEEYE